MRRSRDLLKSFDGKLYEKKPTEEYRRDVFASALVRDVVRHNRANQVLKYIFMGILCAVFAFICVMGAISVLLIARKVNITPVDLGVAAAALGCVLAAVLTLPRIIARHMFPADDARDKLDFVRQQLKTDKDGEAK